MQICVHVVHWHSLIINTEVLVASTESSHIHMQTCGFRKLKAGFFFLKHLWNCVTLVSHCKCLSMCWCPHVCVNTFLCACKFLPVDWFSVPVAAWLRLLSSHIATAVFSVPVVGWRVRGFATTLQMSDFIHALVYECPKHSLCALTL